MLPYLCIVSALGLGALLAGWRGKALTIPLVVVIPYLWSLRLLRQARKAGKR